MASALTILLLSCWLAGRSRVSGQSYYPKPSISLHPSGGVALGGAVTVRCRGPYQNMRFLLYKDGNPNALQDVEPAGDVAEFPIRSMSRRDAGSYSCYYRDKRYQFARSQASDPVKLVVAEPSYPKPSISLRPKGQVAVGGAVTIRCECRCRGARVLLSKAGDSDTWRSMEPAGDVAEFPIHSVSRGDAGSYSCRYSTKWDLLVWSEPSDTVELMVSGGTDSTQPGTTPAPTRPDSAGPGTRAGSRKSPSTPQETDESAPPHLTIIVGASAAAAILLLFLVAFVCFRKTRARKGAAPRPISTSPMVTLKAPAQQDPIYTSINEGKQPQTLEPDPDADGLTYAELDGRALQAKWGGLAPAPEPAQPSLYAAINVSRGAPQ